MSQKENRYTQLMAAVKGNMRRIYIRSKSPILPCAAHTYAGSRVVSGIVSQDATGRVMFQPHGVNAGLV